jgi:hypothetical protein
VLQAGVHLSQKGMLFSVSVFSNPVVRFLKVAFRGEEEDDLH